MLALTASLESAWLCRRRSGWNIHRYAEWLSTPTRHRNPQRGRDSSCLDGVELPDSPRHEEALNNTENRRDPRPAETAEENPQSRPPQIEVVYAECPQEQRKQNANNFIAAHQFILLVKNSLLVWVRRAAHRVSPCSLTCSNIRNERNSSSRCRCLIYCCCFDLRREGALKISLDK